MPRHPRVDAEPDEDLNEHGGIKAGHRGGEGLDARPLEDLTAVATLPDVDCAPTYSRRCDRECLSAKLDGPLVLRRALRGYSSEPRQEDRLLRQSVRQSARGVARADPSTLQHLRRLRVTPRQVSHLKSGFYLNGGTFK